MHFTEEETHSCIKAWKEEFGEEISVSDAQACLRRLVTLALKLEEHDTHHEDHHLQQKIE